MKTFAAKLTLNLLMKWINMHNLVIFKLIYACFTGKFVLRVKRERKYCMESRPIQKSNLHHNHNPNWKWKKQQQRKQKQRRRRRHQQQLQWTKLKWERLFGGYVCFTYVCMLLCEQIFTKSFASFIKIAFERGEHTHIRAHTMNECECVPS